MSRMGKTTQSRLDLTVWDKELQFEIKKHIIGWYMNEYRPIDFYNGIS